MSSNMKNLTNSFLNELTNFKESNDLLNSFLEHLEEKEDPTSMEIQLTSDIYQFLEKLNLLKENLRKYSIDNYNIMNTGNKLSELLKDQGKIEIYD